MATSTINNPEKISTPSVSVHSTAATGSITITVCGRVATLTGMIHNNTTGTGLTLAQIANSKYYPLVTTWLSCDSYKGATFTGRAEAKVTTDGKIQFNIPSDMEIDHKLSGSWITAG